MRDASSRTWPCRRRGTRPAVEAARGEDAAPGRLHGVAPVRRLRRQGPSRADVTRYGYIRSGGSTCRRAWRHHSGGRPQGAVGIAPASPPPSNRPLCALANAPRSHNNSHGRPLAAPHQPTKSPIVTIILSSSCECSSARGQPLATGRRHSASRGAQHRPEQPHSLQVCQMGADCETVKAACESGRPRGLARCLLGTAHLTGQVNGGRPLMMTV